MQYLSTFPQFLNEERKPKYYWTDFETVKNHAAPYPTLGDFYRGDLPAYGAALKYGFLSRLYPDEYTPYEVPSRYWQDPENIRLHASLYSTSKEFHEEDSVAYNVASRMGMLGELFPDSHRPRTDRGEPRNNWDEESIRAIAANYTTSAEFLRENPAAYKAASNYQMLGDLFPHSYQPATVAPGYWTDPEHIRQAAKGYSKPSEFRRDNPQAYNAASKYKMLGELFPHAYQPQGEDRHPVNYWTPERIKEEAARYSTSGEFHKGNASAYKAAIKLNLLGELFPDSYAPPSVPLGHWNDPENIRIAAKQYATPAEFKKGNVVAYGAASRLRMLPQLFPDSSQPRFPRGYWTAERVRKAAEVYQSWGAFKAGNPAAFSAAARLGIMNQLFDKGL